MDCRQKTPTRENGGSSVSILSPSMTPRNTLLSGRQAYTTDVLPCRNNSCSSKLPRNPFGAYVYIRIPQRHWSIAAPEKLMCILKWVRSAFSRTKVENAPSGPIVNVLGVSETVQRAS